MTNYINSVTVDDAVTNTVCDANSGTTSDTNANTITGTTCILAHIATPTLITTLALPLMPALLNNSGTTRDIHNDTALLVKIIWKFSRII